MTKEILQQKIVLALTTTGTDNQGNATIALQTVASKIADAVDSYIEAKIGERMSIILAGGILAPTPAGPAPLIPGPNVSMLTKIT
jgi:hypothetical protein